MKKANEAEQKGIFIHAIRSFFKMSQTKKNVENAYNEEKVTFENLMDTLFKKYSDDEGNAYVDSDSIEGTQIKVHKVQKSTVKWNVKKLKEVLGEEYSEKVVTRRYAINDFSLLVKLAKEHGIPWKEFKKCIEYEEVVKDAELDKLTERGLVDEEEIKKCVDEVKLNKPYYLLTEK